MTTTREVMINVLLPSAESAHIDLTLGHNSYGNPNHEELERIPRLQTHNLEGITRVGQQWKPLEASSGMFAVMPIKRGVPRYECGKTDFVGTCFASVKQRIATLNAFSKSLG